MTWANGYRAKFSERELVIPAFEAAGLPPVRVRGNAALICFRVLKEELGVDDIGDKRAMEDALGARGPEFFREVMHAIMVEPPIARTPEEMTEGSILFDDLALEHSLAIFETLMASVGGPGKAAAATFPAERPVVSPRPGLSPER